MYDNDKIVAIISLFVVETVKNNHNFEQHVTHGMNYSQIKIIM